MNVILSIISTFSDEDITQFISYLKRKNRRGDTKNISLFKMLLKGNTHQIDVKLYGKPAKNALHALSKRLQDSLIDFIATKSFTKETSEELEILKLLLAARIFFEHQKNKIAFKTIKKATEKALAINAYAILTEIYHTKIQFAHLDPKLNLTDVIKAANYNLANFQKEQQLNMVYARIQNKLLHRKEEAINAIIEAAFLEFDIEIDEQLSYKSLFQVLNIYTTAAKIKSDYYKIAHFLNKIYQILEIKKETADKNLYYHIQTLNLLAYSYFRTKDFETTKVLLQELEAELEKGHKDQFLEKVNLLKALVANYTGAPEKAIAIFNTQKESSLESLLGLIMCYFQQEQLKEAYAILKTLQHSDAWYEKKADVMWVLKKNLIELLLLIELDKLDVFITKLQRFKRNYAAVLKDLKEFRVLTFLSFITMYYQNPKQVTTGAFKVKVEESFSWKIHKEEDIFVMSFYAWLKAKMENRKVYEVTLELVQA